jgi:hypothetical protein
MIPIHGILHLVTNQHNISRGAGHGDEVAERNLPGFVDNEVVELLPLVLAAKVKGGAADELYSAPISLDSLTVRIFVLSKCESGLSRLPFFEPRKDWLIMTTRFSSARVCHSLQIHFSPSRAERLCPLQICQFGRQPIRNALPG